MRPLDLTVLAFLRSTFRDHTWTQMDVAVGLGIAQSSVHRALQAIDANGWLWEGGVRARFRLRWRMQHLWRSHFGSTPPLGWRLREDHGARWVRFHSLPDSKRYATTGVEREEIMRRHTALGDRTLGRESECVLFTCRFFEERRPGLVDVTMAELPDLSIEGRWTVDESFNELFISVAAAQVPWRPDVLQEALLAIADDRAQWLLFSLETNNVFAPYDGGVDLVLGNAVAVESMRQEFADWLSSHPQGL